MRVYIIGHLGNMSSRYKAILAHLGHTWIGADIRDAYGLYDYVAPSMDADAVIVATPTETHADILYELKDCGRPILCEKPLTKNMRVLEALISDLKKAGTRLSMVSQYDYLLDPMAEGDTVYDYFKHGADGLAWDCINVIWHAKGAITLREDSPVWKCQINGQILNIRDMDHAYVEMLDHWLRDPTRTDYDRIHAAHKKVYDLEAKWRAL